MRLAIVSAAHIHARPYIESILHATDGRSVCAVWDDIPARGRRHAEIARARFEPDLAALVSDPGVDAFVVCAENTRHLGLIRRLLTLGKPIFVEKPLVTTSAEARELSALIRAHVAPVVPGYFLPFSGEHRAVAE